MTRRALLQLAAAIALAPAVYADDAPAASEPSLTDFSVNLYRQIGGNAPNVFASPASIAEALAMLCAGARGETATEIASALQLSPDEFTKAFDSLNALAAGDNKNILLTLANAVWTEQTFPLRRQFVDTLTERYAAAGFNCDFKGAPEASRQRINQWVEQQTHDRIKDLIPSGVIDALTRLVLTNAIYFKATWRYPFDPRFTHDADFTLADGRTARAPLMARRELHVRYHENDTLQVVDLPYKGDTLSMLLVLPRKRDGLDALERGLTPATLNGWTSRLDSEIVDVFLPRFKFDSAFNLASPLKALGMRRAFVAGEADLTGITDSDEGRGLCVTAALHKAFVEVNETGTEAAAATAIIVGRAALVRPHPVFRADHPFLFLIRDVRSGAPLFIGRLGNPA